MNTDLGEFAHHGKPYAAVEALSVIFGAIAFLLYAACAPQQLLYLLTLGAGRHGKLH